MAAPFRSGASGGEMRSRWARLGSLAAVSALVLAACSSNSGSGVTGSSSTQVPQGDTSGSTTRGISSNSIKVGVLAVLSGPLALTGVDIGARARFERQNRSGGIHGRKIQIVDVQDDASDAQKDLAAAQKLVLQDQVFAVVEATNFLSGQYLNSQKVPVYGWNVTPNGCNQAYDFGITGCNVPINPDQFGTGDAKQFAQVLGGASGKTVVIPIDDDPSARAAKDQCTVPFTSVGFKLVGTPLIPISGVTDYTPYVQQILTANQGKAPDLVFACTSVGSTIGLTSALTAAGFKGAQGNGIVYDPRLLQSKQLVQSLNHVYVVVQWQPFEANTAPIQQMTSDVHAVAPQQLMTLAVASGYWAADMMIDMLQKVGPDPTAEKIARLGNSGYTFGVADGLCPVTFPKNHFIGGSGSALVQISDGKYVVAAPLQCGFPFVPKP